MIAGKGIGASESVARVTARGVEPAHLPRAMVVVFALAAFAAAAFWPTTRTLLAEWGDTESLTYTHGYLIVAISAWLVWRERMRLVSNDLRVDMPAVIGVALLSLVWLVAYRAGLQLVHQLLVPAIAWLALRGALGSRAARTCAFAFAFLYFAIPVWSQLNLPLQDATVFAVRWLLKLTGVPAFVTENIVHVPAGVFEIAGGCSGLHFFVVALAIAALYGELSRDTLRSRVLLLLLAAAVAMVSNWVRVYIIILAGHLTDMQHFLVRVDHYYFGWVVFAFAMWGFFALARRLPLPAGCEAADEKERHDASVRVSAVAAAIVAMLIGPAWSASEAAREVAPIDAAELLPANPGVWRGPFPSTDSWAPAYPGADATARGEYRRGDDRVTVYVAAYATQRQDKELIGYGHSVLGETSSDAIERRRVVHEGRRVNEIGIVARGGRSALLWYDYRIGNMATPRGLAAQLYYGVASLISDPVSRVVALRSDCSADCEAARAALADLFESLDEHAVPGG